MPDDHKFQVNLRGIIDLLSHHLYSGPQVYIRELLQNAADALVARRHHEPDFTGRIQIDVMPGAARTDATLIIHDNGIGLSESEVHEFLSTIGRSSKRESLERDDFIGQFGIGLLSGFVVSEEIVVITRSAVGGHPAVEWKGRADGTYSLRTLDRDFDPGTQVYLRSKPGCHEFFEPPFVRETARHYGGLLPFPITVQSGDTPEQINSAPPWEQEYDTAAEQREAFLQYGRDVFEADFFDAIPLASETGDVRGIAFILPHAANLSARRAHRVYLKHMLLSEKADNLLPDWAFFVKCIVNVNDLRPTAARESFYEDEYLSMARDTLGECLRQYLIALANTDRLRLNALIALHYLAIKALAVEDEDFYRIVIDWLPFETSFGQMTLAEYRAHTHRVRFVETRDEFRQIASVAAAQSICIINGGYAYDSQLIARLPEVFPELSVEQIDVNDLARNFNELTPAQQRATAAFRQAAAEALNDFDCVPELKQFEPAQLPTLYTVNESASFLRSVEQTQEITDEFWSEILDGVSADDQAEAQAQLCFNLSNPLIRKIVKLRDAAMLRSVVEMLYVQSLLMGHFPLKAREMSLLNTGLLGLIERGVNAQEDADR